MHDLDSHKSHLRFESISFLVFFRSDKIETDNKLIVKLETRLCCFSLRQLNLWYSKWFFFCLLKLIQLRHDGFNYHSLLNQCNDIHQLQCTNHQGFILAITYLCSFPNQWVYLKLVIYNKVLICVLLHS